MLQKFSSKMTSQYMGMCVPVQTSKTMSTFNINTAGIVLVHLQFFLSCNLIQRVIKIAQNNVCVFQKWYGMTHTVKYDILNEFTPKSGKK